MNSSVKYSLAVERVSLGFSTDPLRPGPGHWHPLQHHRSRSRSAAQRHLQHRPRPWQDVCHQAPGQRGEGFLPCKKTAVGLTHLPASLDFSALSCCMHACPIISQLSPWKCALLLYLPPCLPFCPPVCLFPLTLMLPAKQNQKSEHIQRTACSVPTHNYLRTSLSRL